MGTNGERVRPGRMGVPKSITMREYDRLPKAHREVVSQSWFGWGLPVERARVFVKMPCPDVAAYFAQRDMSNAKERGGMPERHDHALIHGGRT